MSDNMIAAWTVFEARERPRVTHWSAFQAGYEAALSAAPASPAIGPSHRLDADKPPDPSITALWEEVEKALEPFAAASDACDEPSHYDQMSAWETPQAMAVNIGDFRRARTVLDRMRGLRG